MLNTIQVNDKVIFNPEDFDNFPYRDCTLNKSYLVQSVGIDHGRPEPDAVVIIDDVGDVVVTRYQHVTVVEVTEE